MHMCTISTVMSDLIWAKFQIMRKLDDLQSLFIYIIFFLKVGDLNEMSNKVRVFTCIFTNIL